MPVIGSQALIAPTTPLLAVRRLGSSPWIWQRCSGDNWRSSASQSRLRRQQEAPTQTQSDPDTTRSFSSISGGFYRNHSTYDAPRRPEGPEQLSGSYPGGDSSHMVLQKVRPHATDIYRYRLLWRLMALETTTRSSLLAFALRHQDSAGRTTSW